MKLLLILFLPVIGILGLIAKTEHQLRQGETLMVEIAGYDPRDMLKGHYLNFRFKWKFDLPKTIAYAKKNPNYWNGEQFLCVNGKGEDYTTYPVNVDETKNCDFAIRGKFSAQGQNHNYDHKLIDQFTEDEFQFRTGVEEFYIPEEHASKLEALLRKEKCHMEIQLNHQQRPLLKELYINRRPWRTFLP